MVDGDRIDDFSGQGVPLVDYPVCDMLAVCRHLVETWPDSLLLWPLMSLAGPGWESELQWAGGSTNSLRYSRWVRTAGSGHHVDGAYGERLGRQDGLRTPIFDAGYQFGGSPLHLLQGFGVFLSGRGPDNCGIFQVRC